MLKQRKWIKNMEKIREERCWLEPIWYTDTVLMCLELFLMFLLLLIIEIAFDMNTISSC